MCYTHLALTVFCKLEVPPFTDTLQRENVRLSVRGHEKDTMGRGRPTGPRTGNMICMARRDPLVVA